MKSLFILQLVCCVITAMLALQLAMASLQVRWKVWRYEISRWILVASMLFFSVHYLLQMIHGLRAQGTDVGAAFNILFYTPVAFAITLSIINIESTGNKVRRYYMRKVFILLFISLALLSCQKEENNRKTEYQVLTSKDASKPFSCLGEKRIITITIIKKTLIDDVLSSEVPIIPRDVSVEFDKTLFSDIEIKVEGDQVVLNITSNINKEDKILNADLQISYSTINGIKVEKIPLIIDKGKLTFVYKIHSEQNPFILPAEGGRFELPFTCKKQTYLNGQFIEETYSSLNGLRFKTISSGNVWFLTVRKDGEKIGFYKFSFVGEGPYNQKTDPECYFNIYTHDADLITDNPTEIFRQDFIQPQTPGEDYYKPSRSSYKHGTFDF